MEAQLWKRRDGRRVSDVTAQIPMKHNYRTFIWLGGYKMAVPL